MPDPVVTRFAPSPTGFLHIGGARTALFNWLYARAKGGRMLLRIEDTDIARSSEEAVAAILDGLSWLGIAWDGAPVSQRARAERHRQAADQLLATGRAYPCYASPEELAAMRERARAEGRPPRYDGVWRDRDPAEAPAGVTPAIRLKAEQSGETVIDDQVQGRVVFANDQLDDLVLLRSDGSPTYMLSVVVDDHDMAITHVIRGDDHLTNAARQTQIYAALGWSPPIFAHIPLIHGPDGAKLSKRHGALGVEAYRAMGYLPAALRNYLVRLGWSHGNDEIISTEEMIAWFDLSGVNKAAARFDFAKLESLNGHYIRETSDEALFEALVEALPYLQAARAIEGKLGAAHRAQLRAAIPTLKARAKTLNEVLDMAGFIFAARPLGLDDKAAGVLGGEARSTLGALAGELAAESDWSAQALEARVRAYAEAAGLKLGQAAQPLRAALTGRTVSPPVFDVLAVLGREESLARIADQAR